MAVGSGRERPYRSASLARGKMPGRWRENPWGSKKPGGRETTGSKEREGMKKREMLFFSRHGESHLRGQKAQESMASHLELNVWGG
jgi:hypothetical protein